MKDILDIHSHTIASGHAYNTLYEMARAAAITAWNCSAPLITARPFREAAMKCTFVILNPFQRSCLE